MVAVHSPRAVAETGSVRVNDMATDFRAAFNQLADTFKQLATDAHKRRIDPLIRDVANNAKRGGRLILDAYKAGALPGFGAWYDDVYGGWTFDPSESPEEHVWTLAITFWLCNEYGNRLPDKAGNVDFTQWKLRPDVKRIVREWTDDDGTRHFESKLPDDALEVDGTLFGQFKHDEIDAIERTYQRLTTYVAAAQLLTELVIQVKDDESERPVDATINASRRLAWQQRVYASEQEPSIPTDSSGDRRAYDWLVKHGDSEGEKPGGRVKNQPPLPYKSWSRYVRGTRFAMKPESVKTRSQRAGRQHGPSVIQQKQA